LAFEYYFGTIPIEASVRLFAAKVLCGTKSKSIPANVIGVKRKRV
jgi:hypothetical protein